MSNFGYGKRDLGHLLGRGGGYFGRGRRGGRRFGKMMRGGRGSHRATDLARNVGESARTVAHRVGMRRGLLGLLVLGGAILGSIALVRRMRDRREHEQIEGQSEDVSGRKLSSRKRRRAMNEYIASTAH